MDEILTVIISLVMIIASVVAYVFVMKTVLPRFVIKRRYFIADKLGRGMKKYVSGSDRAIVYEPAPALRKYIKKYALIESGGHKYFKCLADEFVRTVQYSIVMIDNRNRVIDVLEVDESPNRSTMCGPIFLHSSTSYIALTVHAVNERLLEDSATSYYLARDVGLYALAVGVLSFMEMMTASNLISTMINAASAGSVDLGGGHGSLVWPSILIGALAAVILLFNCSKKNVRVLFHD